MVARIIELSALAVGCAQFILRARSSHVLKFSCGKIVVQNVVDEGMHRHTATRDELN